MLPKFLQMFNFSITIYVINHHLFISPFIASTVPAISTIMVSLWSHKKWLRKFANFPNKNFHPSPQKRPELFSVFLEYVEIANTMARGLLNGNGNLWAAYALPKNFGKSLDRISWNDERRIKGSNSPVHFQHLYRSDWICIVYENFLPLLCMKRDTMN